jgi:hypothetical protein
MFRCFVTPHQRHCVALRISMLIRHPKNLDGIVSAADTLFRYSTLRLYKDSRVNIEDLPRVPQWILMKMLL